MRRALLFAYLAATLAYLAWRAAFTLNPGSPAWSGLFLALEIYAAWCSVVFYALLVDRPVRTPPPAPGGQSVDVFVCTLNEPVALVRQTLRRALAMDLPHRTFLLDDGNRAEARALAAELGCGYFAREKNTDYKAGNLNHALARTAGELVVVLDADHLVRPHFLSRLLGYFEDPSVALVQTPQVFYNVDSFQHHFSARRRRLWHEGAVFHHALQPGADRWNAAFFVGTGAVLRRSALEQVGGFATGTVTEDCHTSLRLHAKGYRSVYHDEPLGYLQAPQSLLQYLTQRLRWGQGSMQILRRENPLWKPGLTPAQRLVYFNALSSFAQAAVHLAYYLAPALFLLGGPAPLRVRTLPQFAALAGHFAVDVLMFRIFAGGLARPLLCECYKFLNVFVYLKALGGLFARERLRFQVTTKGRDLRAPRRLLAPQLALLLLNTTAFAAGCLQSLGATEAVERLGYLIATGFAGLFVVVGGTATAFAWQRMAQRSEYAFPDDLPASIAGTAARVVRINEQELQLVAPVGTRLPDRPIVWLELRPPAQVQCRLASLSQVRTHGGDEALLARLRFDELPQRTLDQLFDRIACEAMPRVVDRLLRGEADPPAEGSGVPAFFLPVESNVL